MTLGNRIRELRKRQHWTQKELADHLGLTPKMISFYENNERTPPADILISLSQLFHASTDYLLGLQEKIHDGVNDKTSSSDLDKSKRLLNEDEYALISLYRNLDHDFRIVIYGKMLEALKMQRLLQQEEKKEEEKSSPKKRA